MLLNGPTRYRLVGFLVSNRSVGKIELQVGIGNRKKVITHRKGFWLQPKSVTKTLKFLNGPTRYRLVGLLLSNSSVGKIEFQVGIYIFQVPERKMPPTVKYFGYSQN